MAKKSVTDRRKIRSFEAKRDDLLEKQKKNKVELAKVREELAHARKG